MARSVCDSLSSFLAMDILERAVALEAQGRHIVHMEVGQPDFATPECIVEAATRAMRDGHTGYTHSMGMPVLREAIAAYYEREYGLEVHPDRVVVTNGSSPGLVTLFSALCENGDRVLMADPTYACYDNVVRYAGGEPVRIPAAEEEGFQLDPEAVRREATGLENGSAEQERQRAARPAAGKQGGARAVLVNSPSNPAGTLIDRKRMQALADAAQAGGGCLVSDEIYHGLVYEGKAVSALEVSASSIVLDGFSKRYAMTGWRLGWMVVPPELVAPIQVMQQNFYISPNSISQWAGLAALSCADEDVRRMAAEYDRRRVLMVDGLRALGFGVRSQPVGAFYVLADARPFLPPGHKADSLALAFDILEKAGVGVTPGIDFGSGAEGYIRFSYASSLENIEEAMHRLAAYRNAM